jgi:hypothetical protein
VPLPSAGNAPNQGDPSCLGTFVTVSATAPIDFVTVSNDVVWTCPKKKGY